MAATLTLGGVTLGRGTPANLPEQLAMSGKLVDNVQVLSDGTQRLEIAGYQQQDIPLTGTYYVDDGNGDPIHWLGVVRAMQRAARPVTLRYGVFSFSVIIRDFTPTLILDDRVQYSLTLFVGKTGVLSKGAAALPAGTSGTKVATKVGGATAASASAAAAIKPPGVGSRLR